jgi:uncharacterized Zn-binding protein involved in type VI secretion
MPNGARVGDTISHGGGIVAGSPNVFDNGIAAARLGDAVVCRVHGAQTISSASPNVFVNGIPRARLGDSISCGATITTASPDTTIN